MIVYHDVLNAVTLLTFVKYKQLIMDLCPDVKSLFYVAPTSEKPSFLSQMLRALLVC